MYAYVCLICVSCARVFWVCVCVYVRARQRLEWKNDKMFFFSGKKFDSNQPLALTTRLPLPSTNFFVFHFIIPQLQHDASYRFAIHTAFTINQSINQSTTTTTTTHTSPLTNSNDPHTPRHTQSDINKHQHKKRTMKQNAHTHPHIHRQRLYHFMASSMFWSTPYLDKGENEVCEWMGEWAWVIKGSWLNTIEWGVGRGWVRWSEMKCEWVSERVGRWGPMLLWLLLLLLTKRDAPFRTHNTSPNSSSRLGCHLHFQDDTIEPPSSHLHRSLHSLLLLLFLLLVLFYPFLSSSCWCCSSSSSSCCCCCFCLFICCCLLLLLLLKVITPLDVIVLMFKQTWRKRWNGGKELLVLVADNKLGVFGLKINWDGCMKEGAK